MKQFDASASPCSSAAISVQAVGKLPVRKAIAHVGRGEIFSDGFRFHWHNIATFDVHGSDRVDYLPGPAWRGTMPASFYSTVAAMLLAGRGFLPYHATAIELDKRAYLLTGRAGAGKSTLAAELIEAGARLISDDLTMLQPPTGSGNFRILRGRPGMRLHADTAARMEYSQIEQVTDDARGKLLLQPKARVGDAPLNVAGIVILANGPGSVAPTEAMHLLPHELFRRRWCNALPNHGRRKAWLLEMASRIPVVRAAPVAGFDPATRRDRVKHVQKLLSSLSSG